MNVSIQKRNSFANNNANVSKLSTSTSSSIAYVHSSSYVASCDRGFKVKSRASVTHALITAYGLHKCMDIIEPGLASVDELTTFHCKCYVEYLQAINAIGDLEKQEETALEYGLGYDCPLMDKQFDFVATIAGGSLAAAQCIVDGSHTIAINWAGGWHHGKKDEAAGFCYINDIVLAILRLRQKFERVLYVDLDLHHGDGVEDAFSSTTKVMTVSFHKCEPGFFPGTGRITDVGYGKACYYAVNVPLKDGIQDEQYSSVFKCIMTEVKARFRPNVIVCQCGADGLAGDPMAAFNLSPKGLGQCIQELLSWQNPILFLGGGGYNIANTARCWTYLTSIITGCTIPSDIPDNPYLLHYGPGYDLEVTPSNRTNHNSADYINSIVSTIKGNLSNIA